MSYELLNTFIKVVYYGSFTKAAENLFISSTSVMKQMNSLESYIGVKLFIRTSHGIKLTKAGESFHKDAEFLLKYSKEAIERARNVESSDKPIIRLGVSLLNPSNPFMELWSKINNVNSKFKLKIIPFEYNSDNMLDSYTLLGDKFDFMISPFDPTDCLTHLNAIKLGDYKFCIAVPKDHSLASKKLLSIEDLYGKKITMVQYGTGSILNQVRSYVSLNHPQIEIKDSPYNYSIDIFNESEENNSLLLTLNAWQNIHPSLITIPVDWNLTIPYGLLYPLDINENISEFLKYAL